MLFPSLLASAIATIVFVLLRGSFFETLYQFPNYTPRLRDLLFAAPLGLLGSLAGVLFMLTFNWLRRLLRPLQEQFVLRSVIGGLGLGIAGALLPLTLFSGEKETLDLIAHTAEIGVVLLIGMALVKLLVTALLLASGWKGGYIFPLMFTSVALGLATNLLLPDIPVAVAVATTMAGALVAVLRSPLFAALFTLVLVQAETAPVIAIAIVASALLVALLELRTANSRSQPAIDPPQHLPHSETTQ